MCQACTTQMDLFGKKYEPWVHDNDIKMARRAGLSMTLPRWLRKPVKMTAARSAPMPRWLSAGLAHGIPFEGGQAEIQSRDWSRLVVAVPDMTAAQQKTELNRQAKRLAGQPAFTERYEPQQAAA